MKILILSMTCGEGHNSIARAIKQQFDFMDIESKIEDIYKSNIRRLKRNNDGFLLAQKYIPNIYAFFWKKAKNRNPELRYSKSFYNNDINLIIEDVKEEIEIYCPDAIICTHNYASGIVSRLRHFKKIDPKIKLYSILTDFFPHPYWESSVDIDKVFIPYKIATEQLINKGFKSDQIVEVGVPINSKFYEQLDKEKVKKELGIKENFVVCVSSGGFGIGNNYKVVKKLCSAKLPIGIICLNGKNKKTKDKIDKYTKHNNFSNVYNFGFINNVEKIMTATDLMVSRAGCVTISEALFKNLPIIIRENVKINELENAEVLVKENVGILLKSLNELPIKIDYLLKNKQAFETMKLNCKKFSRLDTTKNICEYVYNEIEVKNI